MRRGSVVSGVVGSIHHFGVFVHLDGEPDPDDPIGFVRVPEITWRHFHEVEEVLATGDRVRGVVIDVDERRMRVYVSLKALQPDPPPVRAMTETDVRLEALRRELLD